MPPLKSLFHLQNTKLIVQRCFSNGRPISLTKEEEIATAVDKKLLMKLRKSTGYSFVNCKRALIQFGDDLPKAEAWLHKQAREEGWQKAAKLEGRRAHQGLLGLLTNGSNLGTIVELNCETDFVARNEKFQSLLTAVTHCALTAASEEIKSCASPLKKWTLDPENLKQMPLQALDSLEGENFACVEEFLNHTLGNLGENIHIGRISCLGSPAEGVSVLGYTHPRPAIEMETGQVLMGQFATLLAFARQPKLEEKFPAKTLAEQVCQHIIGMNPKTLGTLPSAEDLEKQRSEKENKLLEHHEKDQKVRESADSDEKHDVEQFEEQPHATVMGNETELLRQDFLLHPSVSLGHYVTGHGMAVLDFVRLECGEKTEEE